MFSKSLIILLAALSCVNALATPHHIRSPHHHRALAHAARAPVAGNVSGVAPPSKRSLRKRCRNRPTSSSLVQEAAPTSSSSAAPAPPPPTTTSTQAEQTSTSEQAPPPTSTQAEQTSTTEQAPPPPTTSTQAEQISTTEQAPPPPTTTSTTQEQQQPTSTSQEQSQPTQGNSGGDNNSGNNGGNTSGLPSFLIGTQHGQATFYNTGLTACGTTKSDSDAIVAVSQLLFDVFPGANGNPNLNPICGKKVRATYQGKSVDLEIQDRCVGCALLDLDMTPSAFQQIADLGVGRLNGVSWVWV